MNIKQLDFILNDALNKALISKDRIKNPNSNKVADFVNKYISDNNQALQLQQGGVSGNAWIEVLSDHEISEHSKKLEPIWIILEEDEIKRPILCQPDGHDNYYGSDDIIYHYCDISHFMKIQRPVF